MCTLTRVMTKAVRAVSTNCPHGQCIFYIGKHTYDQNCIKNLKKKVPELHLSGHCLLTKLSHRACFVVHLRYRPNYSQSWYIFFKRFTSCFRASTALRENTHCAKTSTYTCIIHSSQYGRWPKKTRTGRYFMNLSCNVRLT